jgi:hypothetical protein
MAKQTKQARVDIFKEELVKMLRIEARKGTDIEELLRKYQQTYAKMKWEGALEAIESEEVQQALQRYRGRAEKNRGKPGILSLLPAERRRIVKRVAAAIEEKKAQ